MFKLFQKIFKFHLKEQKYQNFTFGLTILFKVQVDIAKKIAKDYTISRHTIFENTLMCGFEVISGNNWILHKTVKLSEFQILFHDFIQSTSKYCRRFSLDYLEGKTDKLISVLKLFHKIFEFHMKRAELSKSQISFYEFSQSICKYYKKLWQRYCSS